MAHNIRTAYLLSSLLVFCCFRCYSTENHQKRAPSGFFGMRGKKSIPDTEYGVTEDNTIKDTIEKSSQDPPLDYMLMDKRSPYTSGFVGMRGKKPWTYPDLLYKRTPQGFFGMRGKKDNWFDEDYVFDEYPKRAPMGFFGMRGKKYILQPYYQEDKRAPNGFFGVRGKKEDLFYDEEKRAPQQSAFFGVRGKRMGFYGVRGKKIPFQFRGKFVGVRGKKSLEPIRTPSDYVPDLNLTSKFQNGLEWNQLMLLLTEQDGNGLSNNEIP